MVIPRKGKISSTGKPKYANARHWFVIGQTGKRRSIEGAGDRRQPETDKSVAVQQELKVIGKVA